MGRKSIDNIRKPQILEYFRQVINEEGIHKASVVKIAKKMGVSPNLVLHYFDSKEAMVMELFDVIIDQYIEHLSEVISEIPTGPQRLKILIKTMFGLGKNRQLLSEKSYYAFYYLGLFDGQIKLRFNQKYRQFTDMVSAEIESSGHFKGASQVDLAKQAEFLISLFEGFTFKSNIRINNDHFEEFGDYFFEKVCDIFKLDLD
jgi:AcrR family transcriptional regulator